MTVEETVAPGEVSEETDVTATDAGGDEVQNAEEPEKAEEVKLLTKKTTLEAEKAETDDFTISAEVDKDAKVPEDVFLQATELTKDTEGFDYDAYYEKALKALKKDSDDVEGIKTIRFYDISLEAESQEESVEPKAAVNVKIEYEEGMEVDDEDNVRIVHFAEQKNGEVKAEVLDNKENKVETTVNKESELTEASFDTEGFSVFAVTETETLKSDFVSASGNTYKVEVTYGPEAGIPNGSRLEVVEYSEDAKAYSVAKEKVLAYLRDGSEAPEEFDETSVSMEAMDLTIYDPAGGKIEPKAPVNVKIVRTGLPEGVEIDDLQASMAVQHLAENEDGSINVESVAQAGDDAKGDITVDENGAVAEFSVNSFSTYTVTWGDGNNNRTTLHFVDESGNELTGVKYNGNVIDGQTIRLDQLITSNNTTLNLRDAFTVDGKTLSNTHLNSIQNLGTGNARQIIANEIRRSENNFQYRRFNENGDDSGSIWQNIGNNTDVYLVYSNVSGGSGGGGGTSPDDPEAPDFGTIGNSKVKTDNGNGTYKLNLSVTGQAQSESANNHVNVLIVLDTSSSMSNGVTRLADAKRALVGTSQQEIQASIAHKLLANNTTDDPDIVQLAFVTFSGSAAYHTFGDGYWTSNETDFRTEVNGVGTASGTNWEDAMKYAANVAATADEDPLYVIFLTDGQPSRYWRGNTPNPYVDGEGCMLAACDEARALRRDYGAEIYGIFAWGTGTNFTKDYLGKMIGYSYNNNDIIESHRFNGENSAQLVSDLEKILNIISLNFGFADVTFNDGITGLTSTDVSLATVEEDAFEYAISYVDARDGQTHTVEAVKNADGTISIPSVTYYVQDRDHPGQTKSKTTEAVTVTGAEYTNGRVIWHIEQTESTDPYILEEAWTYTVSFDIWPSQHAYDLVAALNNNPSIWGNSYKFVDDGSTITYDQYSAQITGGPDGPFELKTNTDANVTYKQVTAKTVDGKTTYEYSDPIEVPVTYQGGMSLTSEEMPIQKLWNNPLDSREVEDSVNLSVTLDDEEFLKNVILDTNNDYKMNVFIACGIITESNGTYKVKEQGHDFTFSEVNDENKNYWNLEAEVYRPMLINGVLTLLVKVDSTDEYDYKIGDEYFKKTGSSAATISATNVRRSRLNLRKHVTDETDGTADPDAEFTYTVTINEANEEPIYFSVFGTNGAQYLTPEQGVKVSDNVEAKMMQDDDGSWHQYYIAPAGESFTVNAKAEWSLMFLNLSNETTYTITESEMPVGFEFDKAEGTAVEYYYADPNNHNSRTTRPIATNMELGLTTTGTIKLSNSQYRVDYTNIYKSKDVTLIKVKEDGQTEIGGAVFDIAKKNVAGSFVSVAEFTSSTEDEVLGEVFKLGYGMYCLTETKAPDGYNILTNKIYFNLTPENGIVLCDENGDAITYDNAVVSGTGNLTVTIKNTPGEELPMTGGIGTTIFYILGSLLVIGCGIVLVSRRRMGNKK